MRLKDTDLVVLWGLLTHCGMSTKEMIHKQVPSLAFTATSLPSSNVKQLRLVTQATFHSIHLLTLGGYKH